MTPKEKASELIDKFNTDLQPFSEIGKWDEKLAIKNAIVCVDEILKISYFNHEPTEDDLLYKNYWLHVKNELLNL